MKTLFLALFMVLSGCIHQATVGELVPGSEPIHPAVLIVHADTDFTTEERATIDRSLAIWRAQTSGVANITIVYDLDFSSIGNVASHKDDSVLVRRDSNMPSVMMADAMSGCPGCVLGWTTSGGIHNPEHAPLDMAFVADRMGSFKDELLEVSLHEFGHALGLPHVDSVQSIMYPSVSASRTACLKQADLRAFCDVNDCGGAVTHPCE